MTKNSSLSGSFRDPSGFLFHDADGTLYRQVNKTYESDYNLCKQSGLFDELVRDELLIPHTEASLDLKQTDDAIAILKPDALPFVSYPYEWSFSQLKDAALLTLDIQKRALDKELSLKDASAYNVMFNGAKPVFIDTLSFEAYKKDQPWIAYRQFCRHFLAPLAVMAYNDPRLITLLRTHIDGVPLEIASRMLPRKTWLPGGLLLHIHLHARTEQRHTQKSLTGSQDQRQAKVSQTGLQGIIESLQSTVRKLDIKPARTDWSDYYADNSYTDAAAEHKDQTVGRYLDQIKPNTVWDIGANTGRYSEIASQHASTVIAMEQDAHCVEAAYRKWSADASPILPLVVDLANPSPGLGWAHTERDSLAQRGPADAALALALIHHLAIGNNVPLPKVAEFFATICNNLIIEFVPKEDEMVQFLLSSREDVFPDYTVVGFEEAFTQYFEIAETIPNPESSRILYRMKRR